MKQILTQIEDLVRKYYETLFKEQTDKIDKIYLSEPAYDSREAISAIRTILGGWISQGPNVKKPALGGALFRWSAIPFSG